MRAVTLTLLFAVACASPPEPAPAELDANLAWSWSHSSEASDAALADAAAALAIAGHAETRVEALKARGRVALTSADLVAESLHFERPVDRQPHRDAQRLSLHV